MRIGVVSDTHGQRLFARAAADALAELDVARIIHCGDIGAAEIVPVFANWPTSYVLGNVDHDEQTVRGAILALGQDFLGRFAEVEWDGVRIAFLHGDDSRRLNETIASGEFQLVCHGHTHVWRQERLGETLVLNPGALYRANPRSFAVVELPSLEVTRVTL